MSDSMKSIKPGVVFGNDLKKIFEIAKREQFAIPAVNVVGSDTINAAMEAGKDVNSPVIVQFSNGGAIFNAGKGLKNVDEQVAIAGAVLGAKHIHKLAEFYGVPVIIHTGYDA